MVPELQLPMISRAYPGSEFVVANTLAKSEKLEPNEFFSQKVVSTSYFVFNSLHARGDFCCLLITIANCLDPDQAPQNVGPVNVEYDRRVE